MYLKSLELQGFKSFPDKIELKFNKGITAVVGPNGSGKSNIGDAMRWVMGEQSSKALRGEKMAGVIFHGTQTRPKAPFAQVTITIDNEDGALEYDSDTVSVSRKLYRNGDSFYMINGKEVNLKDIVELFMDTGLGRDGYSIIGQGRIADIVNGKSNDRREIFEEAAGISKFRSKKKEAEKKLAAAEDNLSRINDIMGEIEGRIGPLKAQAEKAEMFRVLDEEKRKLEVSVWVHKLNEYMSQIAGYEEKLSAVKKEYEVITQELERIEDDINDSFAKSAEKSELADSYKNQIHQVELENSQALSKIAVYENDISHLEDNILKLKEQISESNSSKYYLEAELKTRRQELEELDEKKAKQQEAVDCKEKELSELIDKTALSDKSVSEAGSFINELYMKKSEVSFRLENAKNNLSDIDEQIENSLERKKQLEEHSKLSSKELKELRESKGKADENKQELTNRMSGLAKLLETRNTKLSECRKNLTDTEIQLRDVENRIKTIADLENSMEGFQFSVKHIMKASQQGRISGICGTVSQLISVETKYSVAIETALGGALQNIVVNNEDSAKRGIRLLKENRAGRATFLPVTSVRGNRLNMPQLENEEGFVALGCELVKYDSQFEGVINSLLGRICIAEDIDSATLIAKKYGYKFRIVTLDGQVINAGGSFTGGSVSKQTGLLTRKNEAEALAKKKTALENSFTELKQQVEKLNQEVSKYTADTEGLREKLSQVNSDILRFEMEIKRVSEYYSDYENKLDEIETFIETLKNKYKIVSGDIDKAQTELSEIEAEISDNEAKLADSQNEQAELKNKREQLSEELSQMKIMAAELSKDLDACKLSISQLEETIGDSDTDSGKLNDNISECEKKIAEKKELIFQTKQELSGADEKIAAAQKMAEQAQREHIELDNAANKLRTKQKHKMDEKETLSGQITRAEEQKKSVTAGFDKLVAQLWDDYELTRSDAAEIAEDIVDITVANRRLNELRGKIRNLGSVNLGAIEEYAEVSQRHEFLTCQLNDVNTSKTELEKLIEDLTENMKNMFTDSFERINANFKKIFTELFGGGQCELILTDPNNVLECGIEINVQPPGKVITNLMSLSGGEQALVAIAIYFAILKISPSPFCLLDEIEAALDDVNVSKYAQYLHHLTDKTQFITITHRRGTMEEADVLYGVTMQEKGVSKLLKMDVSETRQMKLE